jgi:hypothetical protein
MRALATILVVAASIVAFSLVVVPTATAQGPATFSACIAHHPLNTSSFGPYYTGGCTGHDEPELDPVSNLAGSARDLTWTVVLPSNGALPVDAVGPTFWFGGTVNDPHSLFGQAFVELQFYPNALVSMCEPDGGFTVSQVTGDYTVCSPVWKVTQTGTAELAAFNAMLTDGTKMHPLVMHAGDELTIHWFTTAAADGFHVTVHDLTTGGSGTIVLDSQTDGPLMPTFEKQLIGNALAWGIVNDTPNSFVWEIGHTSDFATPAAQFCEPGQTICDSYNARSWAGTLPIQIKSVTFADGSTAKKWAVVSDFGGKAEVLNATESQCTGYGGPFCIYPWFTLGTTGFHYGVDFPGTVNDFGKVNQFQQEALCGGPFGPDTTYCDTVIVK